MKAYTTLILLILISFSCSKNSETPSGPAGTLPSVSTTAISSITSNSSISGGNVTTDGGVTITVRGVCWGTSVNPVIGGAHSSNGGGIGIFSSGITGLTPSTTYYVRAYATNSIGTAYGNEINFTTSLSTATLASVSTSAISNITSSTASGGGNISSDGGASVTARGICWDTTTNPGVSGNHTTDGAGIGSFTSAISGLTPGKNYFVRAYATNTVGTAYGNQVTFSTLTGTAAEVTICTQTWMGKNLDVTTYQNGDPIPQVTDSTVWINLTTGAWCYFNNDSANNATYGKLYNWYAVNDPRGLAPAGFHVPTDSEWQTLQACLGDANVAGGKMKTIGTIENNTGLWHTPNANATNSSGFSAVPGGDRGGLGSAGNFYSLGNSALFWSATVSTFSGTAWGYGLSYINPLLGRGNSGKASGFSVRCIKN